MLLSSGSILDRYLDEQVFRFNHRKGWNDLGRFHLAMSGVAGKRLTYAELAGANGTVSATSLCRLRAFMIFVFHIQTLSLTYGDPCVIQLSSQNWMK
jgi:hypothetical protein